MPLLNVCNQPEQCGNIVKTFFFGVIRKCGIDPAVFRALVQRRNAQALLQIPAVEGIAGIQVDIVELFPPL